MSSSSGNTHRGTLLLDGATLTFEALGDASAEASVLLALTPEARARAARSRSYVE